VLVVEDQLFALVQQRGALQRRTAALEARLEALARKVRDAVGEAARSPEDDPVTRCANHIESAVDEMVARVVGGVRGQHETAAAEIAARERKAHALCLEAVATFLRKHDFPDATFEVELEVDGAGHLVPILRSTTPYQVIAELELDVAGSPFATPELRASSIAKTRLKDVKLDKLIVTGARCDPQRIELRLRTGRDPKAEGFDLSVERAAGQVALTRHKRGDSEAVPLVGDDLREVAALATALADGLERLSPRRTRLRSLSVDDTPLDEHERPSALVDRIFFVMAPQVREIVERSKTPGELRLRRDLGDGRREEIFVPHAKLAEVVDQVPVARRRHFDALGIPGLTGSRLPTVEIDPDAVIQAVELSEPSISIDVEETPENE
jgi:hypothetical protein